MEFIDPHGGVRQKKSLGKLSVDVVVSPRDHLPRPGVTHWFSLVSRSIMSLFRGMKITIGYFVRPSTVVTQQYPENRESLKMFDRFRGRLKLTYDDKGNMNCTGCNFCGLACPNGTITIRTRKNPVTDKAELDQFVWRLDSCTFCNACIQACPYDAIEWGQDFEAAVYDRRLLVYGLNTYAGPPASIIQRAEKKQENVEALKATNQSRQRYEGKLPLAGVALPGVPALERDVENTE